MEMLQLSVAQLQDSLSVQCLYDGLAVRSATALAAAAMPLLLLGLQCAQALTKAGISP